MGKKTRTARVPMPEEAFPLIRRLAFRLARRLPRHVQVDDLMGAGWIGYIDACQRFDPRRGSTFAEYAEYRIRGAMLDELRTLDPYGRDTRAQLKKLGAATTTLAQELSREPSREEIAERLDLAVEKVEELSAFSVVSVELDALAPQVAEQYLADEVTTETLVDFLEALRIGRQLEEAFKCLEAKEERIIRAYFYEDMSEREIGEKLGVTESRVCQILGEALSKLRPIYEAITCAEGVLRRENAHGGEAWAAGDIAPEFRDLQAELAEAMEFERSSSDDPKRIS